MHEKLKTRVALVVDDEPFARLFVLQILLDLDFVVLEAGDAAEGWQMLLDNEDVTVLITDISMPGDFDGVDLAKRATTLRPDIGVVLVSGCPEPVPLPAPEHVFVAKPYTPRALFEALSRVWGSAVLTRTTPLAMTALGSIASA